MITILVISLVSVLCLKRFTMWRSRTRQKFGILAYAVNTMKSVMTDQVFNIKVETENGNYDGEASHVWFS